MRAYKTTEEEGEEGNFVRAYGDEVNQFFTDIKNWVDELLHKVIFVFWNSIWSC